MVVLLVLSIILVFLTIDYFAQRAALRESAGQAAALSAGAGLQRAATALEGSPSDFDRVHSGVFVAPGHVWMRLEPSGSVLVGVDRLLVSLLGGVDHVYTVEEGRKVERGGPLVMLRRGSRALKVRSPVAGKITAVNSQAREAPGRLAEDPFQSDWLYRIQPEALYESLRQSVVGREAANFLHRETRRLADLVEGLTSGAESPLPLAADGGEPAPDLADRLGDREWEELVSKFFAPGERGEGALLPFHSRDGVTGA